MHSRQDWRVPARSIITIKNNRIAQRRYIELQQKDKDDKDHTERHMVSNTSLHRDTSSVKARTSLDEYVLVQRPTSASLELLLLKF